MNEALSAAITSPASRNNIAATFSSAPTRRIRKCSPREDSLRSWGFPQSAPQGTQARRPRAARLPSKANCLRVLHARPHRRRVSRRHLVSRLHAGSSGAHHPGTPIGGKPVAEFAFAHNPNFEPKLNLELRKSPSVWMMGAEWRSSKSGGGPPHPRRWRERSGATLRAVVNSLSIRWARLPASHR